MIKSIECLQFQLIINLCFSHMSSSQNTPESINILEALVLVFKKVFNYIVQTSFFIAIKNLFIRLFWDISLSIVWTKVDQWLNKKSLKRGFLFLLLLMRAPLLKEGYLFMLDRVITPEIAHPVIFNTNIFNLFLYLTQFIFPTWIGEKILRIGIFALGWLWIIRLYNLFDDQKSDILRVLLLAYFWINPFIYARTLDGHLNVVTITMILPWLLYFIYNSIYSSKNLYTNIWGVILAFWIMGGASPHWLLIGLWVTLIVYSIYLIIYKFRLSIIRNLILVIIGAIAVNSRRLLPSLKWETGSSQVIWNFDKNHLTAFQTHDMRLWIYLNPLALRWYRGEIQNRMYEHHDNSTLGWIALFIFWSAIWLWISAWWRKNKKLTMSALWLTIAVWILAQGNNSAGIFAWFNDFLFENIPWYIGMRDPQKWLSVLVVFFAIFASKGTSRGLELIHKKIESEKNNVQLSQPYHINIIIACLIIVPLLYSSSQLWWRAGQLHVANYPKSWSKLKSEFNVSPASCELEPCHSLVALPWHSYMEFNFARRTISNPLSLFIGKNIVRAADNVEFGNLIYDQNGSTWNSVDEFVWASSGFWWANQQLQKSADPIDKVYLKEKTRQRISTLKKHGVTHFVYLYESDYQKISWLLDYLILNGFVQSQEIQDEYELLIIK